MREIQREIVAALIISKDGKIFLGMKDPNSGGVYADCWHIPGGGVDEGETKKQAIIREIKEETGIDISQNEFELIDDEDEGESEKILKDTGEKVLCKMKFNVYRVDMDALAKNIKIVLSDDLVKYEWADMSELGNRKLTPPSVTLFKKLGYIK